MSRSLDKEVMKKLFIIFVLISFMLSNNVYAFKNRELNFSKLAVNETRLNVPSIIQYVSPWKDENVGFGNIPIINGGCALTSLSMVLKYYGIDTNPSDLNNWLKNNNGFIGMSINWRTITNFNNIESVRQIDYNEGADLNLIKSEIDSGYPVIAKMKYSGYHYVVICGYSGDKFYINDPWTENPAKTINEESLFEDYSDPEKAIKGIVTIHGVVPENYLTPIFEVKSTFIEPGEGVWEKINAPIIKLKIGEPNMTIDGNSVEIDSGKGTVPVIKSGRTLLPLRSLIEAMGGKIEWEQISKKITITIQGRIIELWVDRQTVYYGGVPDVLEVAPIIINGRTMMPLRQIIESIGCNISWDENEKEITVSK